MIQRLPGVRAMAVLLWAVLLLGLGAAVALHLGRPRVPGFDEKATLSLLKSETLAFLVTRRVTTQVIVEHRESDWSGNWHGVLWCTVSWRWGVDLQKITEKDLRRQGDVLFVKLPEPQLLDFSQAPGSVGFLAKSTAIPKLLDLSQDGSQRRLLEEKVQVEAMKFAASQRLCPSRLEIVRQLNETSVLLKRAMGTQVRFE